MANFDRPEFAETSDIILLYLPRHTTKTLDRSFLGPLEACFGEEAWYWMLQHNETKFIRM
jgi:hypothetical protein